ncbi:hypothetical protein P8891_13420 [Bacillus atrophaeus]|uniref:hypothetical protein n=1 Tax=Bacillus atrophaeus TaxID=1452 RepID=UPI00227FDFB0|nr:hypothetical protein [Bacillus atrophaeus]MCY7947329.1 hypothetical protein [Bacillus atrophaeus]MCY8098662.1 hypothetical protein [Bacillus atrophaeus]MCY8951462.1 hypothetical protein [Bacillus atrophaeus]MCY9168093.1 hypothetical protein [Bacillus atrophaeus]MEC0742033.1 hypothetical protein [Bacillus atrophaeus]
MSKYPYKHDNGSVVCKVEYFKFRFRGIPAADIEITNVPGENAAFSFQIEKNETYWGDIPTSLLKKLHAGDEELKSFGVELIFYSNKHAAMQTAVDTIELILNKYKTPGKLEFNF